MPTWSECLTPKINKMDIEEIIKESPNVTIAVKASDLENWVKGLLEKNERANAERIAAENGETYLSPMKVSEMLCIDRSTLWRWEQTGYLVPFRVGGKVRYKMSDIKSLMSKKGGAI